jgi:tight adherence protein C
MDTRLLILCSVAAGVTSALLAALYWLQTNRKSARRLASLRTPGKASDDERYSQPALFSVLIPQVADTIRPKTGVEQDQLRLKMARAGINGELAGDVFLALKMLGLVAGGALGGLIGCMVFGLRQPTLFSLAIGGCVAFYLPDVVIGWLVKQRMQQISHALPNALDLLIVALEVGQGLDLAVRRVAQELTRSAPALSHEFGVYSLQLQMGRSRAEALHDLGMRCGVPEMNSLAAVLIQADRFGTSIGKAMRQLSESARRKRRQQAEERAQKTAVKLIFPLVLFIFPGIFAVLVGPAVILLMKDLAAMQ